MPILAEHDLRVDIGIGARGLRDTSVLVYRKVLMTDGVGTNVQAALMHLPNGSTDPDGSAASTAEMRSVC